MVLSTSLDCGISRVSSMRTLHLGSWSPTLPFGLCSSSELSSSITSICLADCATPPEANLLFTA
ncbi:hypothetical protein RchiOBHm_Chr6g0247931 [Rosa chinensis]|uniref:Uncharacterized protein n=1 Tax=Rosa chinensis TaxID=74649 RepID=A0A2P6PJZ1_ROSCH|nr:hypothetical protein RchiOBHm_Chr6g0247931 [Rosa chinensis]